MKARRFFALLLLCALALSSSAYADVAYMPRDDFYDAHTDECVYENKYYLVNSPEGSLVAYSSPTGSAKQSLANGLEFYVSYTWEGEGLTWGCIEYNPETLEPAFWQDSESAWVDMSSMTPRYDSEAFMNDHSDEIVQKSFSLTAEAGEKVLFYRYPGSGIVEQEFVYDGGSFTFDFMSSYTDAEGREWGYIGYQMGIRNVWICVDEPYNPLPAGAEFREPEIYSAASPEVMAETLSEAQGIPDAVVILAVGVLVIAAAIVVYIIIRKRR